MPQIQVSRPEREHSRLGQNCCLSWDDSPEGRSRLPGFRLEKLIEAIEIDRFEVAGLDLFHQPLELHPQGVKTARQNA